ncbi:MAG: hypothetical protein K0S99_323 [Thermomicrobiales bacterium]|nr:hypothetical protein [Thermomicrobiales bacterium]
MGRAGYGSKLPVGTGRGFTALLSIAIAAATLLATGERAAAQDLPAQPSSPAAVEPTPAALEPTPAAQTAAAPAEFAAGAPHVHTIAQGLMGVEGPLVWRVREVGLSATGAPESTATSFTLQRTGAAIIRNELTSRRTRLEAGEAYFMPSGDPFLRYAVGSDPSIIWVIELVPPHRTCLRSRPPRLPWSRPQPPRSRPRRPRPLPLQPSSPQVLPTFTLSPRA